MMKDGSATGGQIIYPVCNDDWTISRQKIDLVENKLREINGREGHEAHLSIRLGGYVVIGANRQGANALLKELPPTENYPFQLINHAAFHTPLLQSVSNKAFEILPPTLFSAPTLPLIDGRGHIWQPLSSDVTKLYEYTLGHQVTRAYDFTQSISVALKEFAPDHLVLLGPGASLGGSIGQIMIENDWLGLKNKAQFSELQMKSPFLLAMGRPEQRP
jgi:[acyl-carrier-protein] S-malonyltransferase